MQKVVNIQSVFGKRSKRAMDEYKQQLEISKENGGYKLMAPTELSKKVIITDDGSFTVSGLPLIDVKAT